MEPEGDPENTQAADIDVNERINILEVGNAANKINCFYLSYLITE